MRVEAPIFCALVAPSAVVADIRLIAAFADGTNRCLHAVGTRSLDVLEGLAERSSIFTAEFGERRDLPGGLAEIDVLSMPEPTLCIVESTSEQSDAVRTAIADWGTYQTAQLLTQFTGTTLPSVAGFFDANALWCDPVGGPLHLSVGQSERGGDLRVAVTDHLADDMPNPCDDGEGGLGS